MILLDMSAILVAVTTGMCNHDKTLKPTPELLRKLMLSRVIQYKRKFGEKYGEMIICYDDSPYWRKEIFPQYKMNRKKSKDESAFDWEHYHKSFDIVKKEFSEYVPMIQLNVKSCEADDLIAVISLNTRDNVLIISGDKDLIQLQVWKPEIKQWTPRFKKFINLDSGYSLIEHILRGDSSDGIPNYLSDDDTFINDEKRQKPLYKKVIEEARTAVNIDTIFKDEDQKANYERNLKMIDLRQIPDELKNRIMSEFEKSILNKPKNRLRSYCIKYKMRRMLTNVKGLY